MECSNSVEYIKTLFDNLKNIKYIRRNRRVYKFFISSGSLVMNIYIGESLIESHEIESNVKYDFDVCSDNEGNIHIISINKKYEVHYIKFDGTHWNRERIYQLNTSVGIPASPKVRVMDGIIYIILSFETPNTEKEWSLKSYIKVNNQWNIRVIDKGTGIFYCQPDFFIEGGNVHLVYRHKRNTSVLKYCFLDLSQGWWEVPKIVLDEETDKYMPNIFIQAGKIVCIWTEFIGEQLYLTVSKGFSLNYFRTRIPENIKNICLLYSSGHIYGIKFGEKVQCLDLCCQKESNIDWGFLIEDKEDLIVGDEVRFFLNIRKEMETENTNLKERIKKLEERLAVYKKMQEEETSNDEAIEEEKPIQNNISEVRVIAELNNKISELKEMLSTVEQENNQLHEMVVRINQENEELLDANEELVKTIEEIKKNNLQEKKTNNQFLKKVMEYIKKDA